MYLSTLCLAKFQTTIICWEVFKISTLQDISGGHVQKKKLCFKSPKKIWIQTLKIIQSQDFPIFKSDPSDFVGPSKSNCTNFQERKLLQVSQVQVCLLTILILSTKLAKPCRNCPVTASFDQLWLDMAMYKQL